MHTVKIDLNITIYYKITELFRNFADGFRGEILNR